MRETIIYLSSLFLLALLTACRSIKPASDVAAAQDHVSRVEAYEKAHNAYDVDAVMAMFTEDAEFEVVGQSILSSREAIRAIHEYDKGIHAQLSFEDCKVDGPTVTCEVREHNDWAVAAGLDDYYYPSSVFTLTREGRIHKIAATMSDEDGAAIGRTLTEFIPWLLAERAEESKPLFDAEGQFIYSEENGRLVVELLRQWQAEK